MKLAVMQVISDGEIKDIHEASLDVLASCGVQVGSPDMLAFLQSKGLPADPGRQLVRFPRACIEDALSRHPPAFDIFEREGRLAFTLGNGVPRVAAGHNAVFWVDSETGQTRPSTMADVAQFARICQQLEGIDMLGVPAMPQDAPAPTLSLLYGLQACVEHCSKPVYFSTDNRAINRSAIAMLKAVFKGDLQDQAYGISQLSPTSPLCWEKGVLEAIMDMAGSGVPLAILPEPNAGVSAPYTLAGLLTVNNAEWLSGLAMAQLLRPGMKTLYANSWTTTDMRTGAALVGAAETTVCRIAAAQLARFYRAPSHTTAPNSDNHAHDEQSAWEKTFSMFCAVASGHDLIVNCGMFAAGMTCSHEQLVMDADIAAISRRIAAGVAVSKETVAAGLIKEIGPHGDYLTAEHTLRWLRSAEHLTPLVAVRGPRALWEAQGAKESRDVAGDIVRREGAAPVPRLDAERAARVRAVLAGADGS